MASATVQLSLPPSSLFKFLSGDNPLPLAPPTAGSTLTAPPFSIPSSIYNSVLDVKVPITIAAVYAVTVIAVNKYNRSAGNKAWPISKTKSFFWFVVAHNVLLAVYSGWTFVGMLGALQRTVKSWSGPAGIAGSVDSLCKIHGTSGLGNAIAYNSLNSSWISESPSAFMSEIGTPDATDMGRLWNEGLSFYGWFFYLSKFYEVLDTVIILAKGKRSSTLQTYHHAGAMMCMWAGIRFMSPPIWMFVFVNSGIHTLMYTYYTLTAFSVPIPQALKRSLTTMQIIQFLVGVAYAGIHSFVTYSIPVYVSDIETSIAGMGSAASEAASVATAVGTASVGGMLKKYLSRSAGDNYSGDQMAHMPSSQNGSKHGQQFATEFKTVPCIGTAGQTFAIWLNVLYLTPLTVLFVRFFIKSYMRRTTGQRAAKGAASQATKKAGAAEKATEDALKGVERELYQNGGMNGKQNGKH